MVSKLNILARYYQIHINVIDNGYFIYDGVEYYLSNRVLSEEEQYYYQSYIQRMQIPGFVIVPNSFGHPQSEGYVLYTYQSQSYDINQILYQSFQILSGEQASLKQIKGSWCNIIDAARGQVGKYAARMNHNEYYVILSYYYQGLAENIIVIINEVLKMYPDDKLPLGYEHSYFTDSYESLFNPDNLMISTRIRDVALAYQQDCIGIETLEQFIQTSTFSPLELVYLYIRILFPSHFFKLVVNQNIDNDYLKGLLVACYQQLDAERIRIQRVYMCISKYVYLPPIEWLIKST